MAVHVDDCTIVAHPLEEIIKLKKMGERVEVTYLGEARWLLGIKITRDCKSRTLHLSQCVYIEDIIRQFNFDDLRPISTPMDPHIILSTSQCLNSPEQSAVMQNVLHQEAVGSLMYTSIATHPDTSFAVGQLTRFF
jgi:hypothetical protein